MKIIQGINFSLTEAQTGGIQEIIDELDLIRDDGEYGAIFAQIMLTKNDLPVVVCRLVDMEMAKKIQAVTGAPVGKTTDNEDTIDVWVFDLLNEIEEEDYDWQDPNQNPYLLSGEELDRAESHIKAK